MSSYDPASKVALARQAALSLTAERGYQHVFISGAPTAGLGTPQSDLDIFVADQDESRPGLEQISFLGSRADIEHISLEALEAAVETVATFTVTRTDLSALTRCTSSLLDTLVRFALSDVVVDTTSSLARLRARLTDDSALTAFVVARHTLNAQNSAEDAEGFLQIEQGHAAHARAQLALRQAIQALLASRGDLYFGEKWLWRQWERSGLDLPHLHSAIYHQPELATPHDYSRATLHTLSLVQDAVLRALTGAVGVPFVEPTTSLLNPRRPRDLWPVMVQDGALVYRADGTAVFMQSPGLLLLLCSHNQPLDSAARLFDDAFDRQVDPDEVVAYHHKLLRLGLLGCAEAHDDSGGRLRLP